ncbi:excalibur calcium-binding domain-containing protein [Kribbella deserti]|uniref:Excalibur calcium-binding domain-containing protein n=1 Tax=Kribbella deserti TaxID=1926257 RepID=A0ABV6QR67_9ACTN
MDRFNSPPDWPAPPTPDWRPPRGWQPDPAWPPAPSGWRFWLNERGARSLGPPGLYGSVSRGRLAAGLGAAALILMGGCTAIVGGDGGTSGDQAGPAPTVTIERTVPMAPVASVPPATVTAAGPTVTVTVKPKAVPPVTVRLPRATVTVTAPLVRKSTQPVRPDPEETTGTSAYYANCAAARAAGAAPLYTGDPGYSRKLDRDGDGVACE